ncbi:MAG: hypothetical protein JWO06_1201 [Bacteroidota bacterium]|nr:hypothetical protein [Bacteroidota bacterium]
MMVEKIKCDCCITGGGPAGVMLGYLLARAGVEVVILEKHKDFFRDFRGDTIHPSALQLMHELDLLDQFLKIPHQKLPRLKINFGNKAVKVCDFSHLPVQCKYIALMPQWDFLNFLAEQGSKFKQFRIIKEAEVNDLIKENGIVTGVKAKTPQGEINVYTNLVVGADGRSSVIRQLADLKVVESGVPIDVLWLHIPKDPALIEQSLGYINNNKMMVLTDRATYFQCGYIIPKGKFEEIKRQGLENFRANIISLAPALNLNVSSIATWDDIKLLTVQINHLQQWYLPGLICIGDAAHAMSPVGGVGINLAIQDAVATANLLSEALPKGPVPVELLKQLQQRRARPAQWIQNIQVIIHNRIVNPNLNRTNKWMAIPLWLFRIFPFLTRIPARIVGMGFRPEHVQK